MSKWLFADASFNGDSKWFAAKCSCCDEMIAFVRFKDRKDFTDFVEKHRFCPKCGAEME